MILVDVVIWGPVVVDDEYDTDIRHVNAKDVPNVLVSRAMMPVTVPLMIHPRPRRLHTGWHPPQPKYESYLK